MRQTERAGSEMVCADSAGERESPLGRRSKIKRAEISAGNETLIMEIIRGIVSSGFRGWTRFFSLLLKTRLYFESGFVEFSFATSNVSTVASGIIGRK